MAVAGDGTCHEAGGCAAPIEPAPRFELPDSDHPPPPEPSRAPAEIVQASCADVGISVASIELGNYADPAARAPTVAKYRARCAAVKLDHDERQCVFEATDKATVTYCAPRMMPGDPVPIVDAKDCTAITAQLGDPINGPQPVPPQWARQVAAVRASCEKDRWTALFGECVRQVQVAGYVLAYCSQAAPAPLRRRIEDRLAKIQ
jgi:hypothetical protein